MNAKYHLNIIFGLSEIHALKKAFYIFFITLIEIHACKEQLIFVFDLSEIHA